MLLSRRSYEVNFDDGQTDCDFHFRSEAEGGFGGETDGGFGGPGGLRFRIVELEIAFEANLGPAASFKPIDPSPEVLSMPGLSGL